MLYEESVDSEERGLRDLHLAYHRGALQLHKRSHNRRAQSAFNLVDVSVPTNVVSSLVASITVPAVPINPVGTSSTDSTTSKGTRPPAQAAAKTTKTTCTPSPTTSMAPSATWTTCRYIGRDGKVNPDVRGLNGPSAINSLSQYVLYGCISAVVNKDSKHAKEAVAAVDRFFLSPSTGMNPNLKYGQVVRGPGPAGISGTFTGILDLRGTVKIVNGLMLLRELAHPDWTDKRDSAMRSWLSQYGQWLTHSDIGKMTGSRPKYAPIFPSWVPLNHVPSNHGTFYVSQLAAAKIFEGSKEEAISILVQFFKKQFIDQIAASGEQPFEAVRTRPYHYRCFNIEALITNAKLGDQLGLDLWSSRSKYGATIQTAMDFIIASDPKGEKASEAVPHVAAVAAAYGDPKGKYAAFLKKHLSNYQSKPFWFYDQPRAVSRDSSKKMVKQSDASGNGQEADHDGASTGTPKSPNIPFTCPDVFKDATRVEIDNGIFVTCDELRPFYELPMPI
ncbi:hypothetical protein CC1G_03654 [Coprinopsis cinerea okayama7|uniref:Alginate lyase domain-containing protein n=1 Tax=Coprinopsis cinerea (strain Okayama-7 / 130 / ATCC MYA-4618 / FGSC 9003) TaxID=240176 RepID=A8N1W1_COPC7|nr:hypothetical protein CC1G_03654 [Coprinopsis cinerea okayama7\|eukprot:XP_001828860.2 hypothetical protein CC1G_03654 [Coprinopsis cinerea okayama7\